MFEKINFNDFWKKDESAKSNICKPFTADTIKEVEKILGYKLPQAYINLMSIQNGGNPKGEYGYYKVNKILGIGKEDKYSLCGKFGYYEGIEEEWGYPEIGFPICTTEYSGHTMIFLDYRECGKNGEPKVVQIDSEFDNEITILANTFEEFINNLYDCRNLNEDETEKFLGNKYNSDSENGYIENSDKLHRAVLHSYMSSSRGFYIFIIISIVLGIILFKSKIFWMIIIFSVFVILGWYFDIEPILKRKYKCKRGKIEKIWNDNGKIICKISNCKGNAQIIAKEYKNIKEGDEVCVIFVDNKIYVIEASILENI